MCRRDGGAIPWLAWWETYGARTRAASTFFARWKTQWKRWAANARRRWVRIATNAADFERCIVANKGDGSKCAESQQALAQCAARAVPMLQTVKEQCGPAIRAYDACMHNNAKKSDEELTEACTPALRALWACTERVKAEWST